MNEAEIIRQTVKATLQELGYTPRNTREWLTFSEAVRLLKPARIGKDKLRSLIDAGHVAATKEDFTKRNSQVRLDRQDVENLLNRKIRN